MLTWVRRVGPHPVLMAKVGAFVTRRKVQRRRLRGHYDARVRAVPRGAEAHLPGVDLPLLDRLPPVLVEPANLLLREADQIVAHRVDYLGSGPVALGDPIDWQRDFKSGYRWPSQFYMDLEITRLDDDSDAKVPWELSRGHQLLTLARAARLSGDERYVGELESQLGAWIDGNPAGEGINWVNAMETALRAVNWVWAVGTVEGLRPLDPELRDAFTRSLQVHGRHIAENLEGTPLLRSNHYLSDILGLLVLGAALDGDPEADHWLAQAHRAFEREITRQVLDDGVGFEASTAYHGLALEIFLLARLVAERAGRRFSSRYDARLRAMLAASRALRHPDGRIPLFGDNDSGRVLPAGFSRRPTHDHLLWLAAAGFTGRAPLAGPPDPEVAWTLGLERWRRAAGLPAEPSPPDCLELPHGGLYVLSGAGTRVVVRCGGVGQNGHGGHAHNDTLSYELAQTGPLVVDPGTYAYTFDLEARNEMRATRGHNAVVVDGEEINPFVPTEIFRLRQVASPTVERWAPEARHSTLVASHDGYRRLAGDVVHRRAFELDRASGGLVVTDHLLGDGEHEVEAFVHLAAGTAVAPAAPDEVDVEGPGGRARVSFAGHDGAIEVRDGWVSDAYGRRESAPVLVARRRGALPLTLTHRIDPATIRAGEAAEDRGLALAGAHEARR